MFSRRILLLISGTFLVLSSNAAHARPNPSARTVEAWLTQYHAEGLREFGDADARYAVAYTDLNGDGRDEAIVYFQSRGSCGSGGCRLYVLSSRRGFWRRVSGHTLVRAPIQVLRTRHRGWRDLTVWTRGGLQGYHAVLPFDGHTYPLNPSVPPAHPLRAGALARVLIGPTTPLTALRR